MSNSWPMGRMPGTHAFDMLALGRLRAEWQGLCAAREHVRPPDVEAAARLMALTTGSVAGGAGPGPTSQTLKTTCPSLYNCSPGSAPPIPTGRGDPGSVTCPPRPSEALWQSKSTWKTTSDSKSVQLQGACGNGQ